jgi:hypothetical protein
MLAWCMILSAWENWLVARHTLNVETSITCELQLRQIQTDPMGVREQPGSLLDLPFSTIWGPHSTGPALLKADAASPTPSTLTPHIGHFPGHMKRWKVENIDLHVHQITHYTIMANVKLIWMQHKGRIRPSIVSIQWVRQANKIVCSLLRNSTLHVKFHNQIQYLSGLSLLFACICTDVEKFFSRVGCFNRLFGGGADIFAFNLIAIYSRMSKNY